MDITVNDQPRSVDPSFRLTDLLRELQLGERRVAVEINGRIVPRSQHHQTSLADGDAVLIVQAIGGG